MDPALPNEQLRRQLCQQILILAEHKLQHERIPVLLGHLPGGMTGHHVIDLMGHDCCQFGFTVRRLDQAAVDIGMAAGNGKGVDAVILDNFKGVGEIHIPHTGQKPFPDPVDVRLDFGVVDNLVLFLDLHGEFVAELLFIVERDKVETADIGLIDGTAASKSDE
jgi:hypothetical protein